MTPNEPKNGLDVRNQWRAALQSMTKNPGSLWVLLGLIVLGLTMLLWGKEPSQNQTPARVESNQNQSASESGSVREQKRLETELTQILSRIDGVGEVQVEITLQSGGRRVWERQSRRNKRISQDQGNHNDEEDTSDELVLAKERDGQETPVLKEELAPEIQGVAIVADGAREARIKELLTQTVMTVLDLPAHRVMVIPGSSQIGGRKQ